MLGNVFMEQLLFVMGMFLRVAINFTSIVKGKAIPLQAGTGPEVSRSLRLPYFKTIGT
jgi:hypothetical protein